MAVTTEATGPKLWVPGDWNAFFGFGTNILVNLLVLTGLLRFVLKMPDELVFGRILPATGAMLPQHSLLCVARLQTRQANGACRCLRTPIGHQCAAHVRGDLRGDDAHPGPHPRSRSGLERGSDLGVCTEL